MLALEQSFSVFVVLSYPFSVTFFASARAIGVVLPAWQRLSTVNATLLFKFKRLNDELLSLNNNSQLLAVDFL